MFNPHLACDAVLGSIPYPQCLLYKLNGVRGGVQGGVLTSRQLKPIPNHYVRGVLSDPDLDHFEGELVVGAFDHPDVFTNSTSGVMSEEGEPDFCWYMFDFFHPTLPFIDRIQLVSEKAAEYEDSRIQAVPWKIIHSDEELEEETSVALSLGYEGSVLRRPTALYKEGRSTSREASFMRYVPWHRSEAIIQEIIEGQINQNESKRNALGYLEKSSHKNNKVGSGRAGAAVVFDVKTGMGFKVPILGVELQNEVWLHRDDYRGKILKYKFRSPVKGGGAPRFPQWEGIRHPDDL